MKKLKVFMMAAVLMLVANEMKAQGKIGYIDAETVLYLMPEVSKIDSLVRIYQRDTVGAQYNQYMQEYTYKDSIYRDSVKPPPPAVKEQIGKELQQLVSTLSNWQQIAQEAVQNKQQTLLAPVMKKISDAINAVAKEKNYAYVVSRDAIIVAPDADNLLPAVAAKLKLTLPPGYKPTLNGR